MTNKQWKIAVQTWFQELQNLYKPDRFLSCSLLRPAAAASAASASTASASSSAAAETTRTITTSSTAAAASALDEDEPPETPWCRLRRRRRHVHFFKTHDEYIRCVNLGVERPPTPRAEDRSMTNEEWRTAVETWIQELQNLGGHANAARRIQERASTVTVVKNTIEYARCLRAGAALPATPRADDPSISTRQWEQAVQTWRRRLRELSSNAVLSL